MTALGPKGTDYLMLMETPRDFSAQAVARVGQAAMLSAAAAQKECQSTDAKRDLGVARRCSNVFGATLVSLQETD